MRVVLCRHGQTDANLARVWDDEIGKDRFLNKTGIEQAQQAAKTLQGQTFDRLIVSQFFRTQQTGAILSSQITVEKTIVDSRINEKHSGWYAKPYKDYYAFLQTCGGYFQGKMEGFESLDDMRGRTKDFLEWLKKQPWKSVLIVSHHDTLMCLLQHIDCFDDAQFQSRRIVNCEIIEKEL